MCRARGGGERKVTGAKSACLERNLHDNHTTSRPRPELFSSLPFSCRRRKKRGFRPNFNLANAAQRRRYHASTPPLFTWLARVCQLCIAQARTSWTSGAPPPVFRRRVSRWGGRISETTTISAGGLQPRRASPAGERDEVNGKAGGRRIREGYTGVDE